MTKEYHHVVTVEIANDGVVMETIDGMDHVSVRSNGSMEWSAYDPTTKNKKMIGTGRSISMRGKKMTIRIDIHDDRS